MIGPLIRTLIGQIRFYFYSHLIGPSVILKGADPKVE